MSITNMTDSSRSADLPFISKDKKMVYLQMPCKINKVEAETLKGGMSAENCLPNITIKSCPIQQLDNPLLVSTISLKEMSLPNDKEISVVSENSKLEKDANIIQLTDATEGRNGLSPSISVVPVTESSNRVLKKLTVPSSTHATITVVKSARPPGLSDEAGKNRKPNEIQKYHIQRSLPANLTNGAVTDKVVNLKISNLPTTHSVKSKIDDITGKTNNYNADSNYKAICREGSNKWQKVCIENDTSASNEKLPVSVVEQTANNAEHICLQVNCNDGDLCSSLTDRSTPESMSSTEEESKQDTDSQSERNKSPESCHLVGGDGGEKVFIRTDSVIVRRRVSKDKTDSPQLKDSKKTFNNLSELLFSVQRGDSGNVKEAKFVITHDQSFSKVSLTNKNIPLRLPNSEESNTQPVSEKAKRRHHVAHKQDVLQTDKKTKNNGDILCCAFCGNYEILQDSLQWNKEDYFCSENCRQEFMEERNLKGKKWPVNSEKIEGPDLIADQCSPAVPFPWADGLRSFSWDLYLRHVGKLDSDRIAAPDSLWMGCNTPQSNPFKPGMKLEAIDPFHQSLFCVATVRDIIGCRVRIHFDGYPHTYDFWCNCDSPFLLPMGWCQKNNRPLCPPPGILNFSWDAYLEHYKLQRSDAEPQFDAPVGDKLSTLAVKMKLEAEDRKNCLICVATVADIIGSRILVTFDGWESVYDSWFDLTSPFVHETGWAQKNDMDLCAPKDYKDPACFSWSEYLTTTRSRPVPTKAFVAREPIPFRIGMMVEAVDQRNPMLLRVATIVDVDGYRVKIHFDGWDDIYDNWIDDDSPNLHPPRWGERTGHPLQPPLTQEQCAEDVDSGIGCGTPGCRGFGHTSGLLYGYHHTIHGCPYSLQNLNIDWENQLIDRLKCLPAKKGPKKSINLERTSSPSVEDDAQGKRVRKRRRFFDEIAEVPLGKVMKVDDIPPRKSPVSQPKPVIKTPPLKEKVTLQDKVVLQEKVKDAPRIENSSPQTHHSIFNPIYSPTKINSPSNNHFLSNLGKLNHKNVSKLKPTDIKCIVDQIDGCTAWSAKFVEHEIDGVSFIMLDQSDLVNILKITLGPSKKIIQCIEHIKTTCHT